MEPLSPVEIPRRCALFVFSSSDAAPAVSFQAPPSHSALHLHIASCKCHPDVVRSILSWKANTDARDQWGCTRNRRTLMTVSNPEIPK
ncbi:hypothetical protein E2562_020337 [Oryza meyeriana var. granulata]|uniref:Uncharacterized protein n=1 Tax=Oryza meyeriana var. granulata TaxID=110450 RepID=A0A6G1EAW0_9ORYZ|nr:hypothetical protein E2562_020337 [Oryza meyeriana var. granulata]